RVAAVLAGCWLLVGQPLPVPTEHDQGGPLAVRRLAVLVPERELVHVAPEMPAPNVVIDTVDPALQEREEALNGVRVYVAAHVLAAPVRDLLMPRHVAAHRVVRGQF